MNALKVNRKPYLSRRVREGARSLVARIRPETDLEFIALDWLDKMIAPKAHDALSPRTGEGGRNPSPLDGDAAEETP